MKKILHKLAHFFWVNYCYAESYYDGDELIPAIKCRTCGEVTRIEDL